MSQQNSSADAVGAPFSVEQTTQQAQEQAILERARQIGETVLGPNAQISDQMASPNRENFRALAEAGFLGLAIPEKYGGLNASGAIQREYTVTLAEYCGVTTFVQAQHHGPCRMIADCPNEDLKTKLLPDLAKGHSQSGVSFAHLRRPGPPILRAEPVENGYRLSGTAPWVTGWGLINQLVFGAALPNGRFVYLWSPCRREDFPAVFSDLKMPNTVGSLTASEPLKLCAMNASATVELTLDGWFIPQEHWLLESDRETMARNDRNGVLNAASMPLGCSIASVKLLRQTAQRRNIPAVVRAADSFEEELVRLRETMDHWQNRSGEEGFFEQAIALRAWVIEFSVRAAHAAVTANSGAANSLSHPAQRLLREGMFYTIQAQTMDVMDKTLARLEREETF